MAAADNSEFFAPVSGLKGSLEVPADKSISHRAAMIAALSGAPVEIRNYLEAADTLSTLAVLAACGIGIKRGADGSVQVSGKGLRWPEDGGVKRLFVGNSGTTIRLLSGIFSGQNGCFQLDGDESIRRRPMDRVVTPLRQMGARIDVSNERFAPLTICGGSLSGIAYEMPMASAQVKSALLFAGLFASGPTTVVEPAVCRDHSEIMLAGAGARIEKAGLSTTIYPAERLQLNDLEVPGDFSSAAFFMVAASIIPHSEVLLTGVGVNQTRTGLLDILLAMGADIKLENQRQEGGEAVADLRVRSAALKGVSVGGELSGRTIDELPLLALAGAFAQGATVVSGAAELKVKESDRIRGLVDNMLAIGIDTEAREDGFAVRGSGGLRGGQVKSFGDHRMAMLGAVAGAASREGVKVSGYDCVAVSFPRFAEGLQRLSKGV